MGSYSVGDKDDEGLIPSKDDAHGTCLEEIEFLNSFSLLLFTLV